ncbi:MAG: terminase small subunit [Proteobacteria bacterium]|nr:terminase small subunit [Pseudomonadota bacterium]
MQRVNDDELLKMLDDKIPQKDIAKHFGVSNGWITKRKQLLQTPEPENFSKLTEQQRCFVIEKVKGRSNVDAAFTAYNATSRDSARNIASDLMQKDEINLSIRELMENHGLTRIYRIKRLKQHVDNKSPDISLKALHQSWQLGGDYAPTQTKNLNLNVDVIPELDQALIERFRIKPILPDENE